MGMTTKRGRPRDPTKLAAVLAELSGDPVMYFEYGVPPYNVADVARRLEMDPSNLRAYLLALERDGLVIRERREVPTWNAIARDHIERRCLCFWNAATMEQDQAAGQEWHDGAEARSAGAAEAMALMFAQQVNGADQLISRCGPWRMLKNKKACAWQALGEGNVTEVRYLPLALLVLPFWVNAEAATDFTAAGVRGLLNSLAAVDATRAEVCSLAVFLEDMCFPLTVRGKVAEIRPC